MRHAASAATTNRDQNPESSMLVFCVSGARAAPRVSAGTFRVGGSYLLELRHLHVVDVAAVGNRERHSHGPSGGERRAERRRQAIEVCVRSGQAEDAGGFREHDLDDVRAFADVRRGQIAASIVGPVYGHVVRFW